MKKIKIKCQGFAFIPLLVIVGIFIFGVGTTVVVTQHLNSDKTKEVVELVTVPEELIDELVVDTQEIATTTEEIVSTTTVKKVEIEVAVRESTVEKTPIKSSEPVHTEEVMLVTKPVEPVTESIQESKLVVETVVKDTSVADELARIIELTYNQVKTESANLGEGIDYLQNRYDELEVYQEKGLKLCETQYKSDVDYAKADAESQKISTLESRTGYATVGNQTAQIDQSLTYDLQRIESVFSSCKSKYSLDTSIKSDIKKLRTDRSSVLTKLSKENSAESLDKIRALMEKALAIGYRM